MKCDTLSDWPWKKRRLRNQVANLKHQIETGMPRIMGNSPEIMAVKRLIRQVAATDSNVLISGESGTGKELVASAIHRLSNRSEKNIFAHQLRLLF